VLNSKAQNILSNESIDSVCFRKICPLLREDVSKQNIFFDKNGTLFKLLNSDSLNIYKNYAICFDCMFELGLDLNNPLPKPLPRNNRFSLDPIINEQLGRKSDDVDPYDLFLFFINIKKFYENNYCDPSRKMDISFFISNSTLSYPLTVKNVLLCNYKFITKEKMYNDLRLHLLKK
jgi:hypothetical protein